MADKKDYAKTIKELRAMLKLTQEEFAQRYHIPLKTLRGWEQKARKPGSAAVAYLIIIATNPKYVQDALTQATARSPKR